ncbi:MAG: hypothetical protein AAB895_04315, partial [Patescibacteria group bacterium]
TEFIKDQPRPNDQQDPFARLDGKRYVSPADKPSEGIVEAVVVPEELKKRGRPPINHDLSDISK